MRAKGVTGLTIMIKAVYALGAVFAFPAVALVRIFKGSEELAISFMFILFVLFLDSAILVFLSVLIFPAFVNLVFLVDLVFFFDGVISAGFSGFISFVFLVNLVSFFDGIIPSGFSGFINFIAFVDLVFFDDAISSSFSGFIDFFAFVNFVFVYDFAAFFGLTVLFYSLVFFRRFILFSCGFIRLSLPISSICFILIFLFGFRFRFGEAVSIGFNEAAGVPTICFC